MSIGGAAAGKDPMMSSLKPAHLPRYKDIAALLLKHGRAGAFRSVDDLASGVEELDVDAEATAEDAAALARELEAMGPTFIKLGQLLSTRSDLLPPAYLEALARLQDDVEPFSFTDVERIVETEVGARMSKAFESFDHVPLATASLGQVHRAVLRDGRKVAVKVQRPDVREQAVADLDVIEELAAFVDEHTRAGRRFGFGAMVEEFRTSMMVELDYRREASHLRLLGEHLAGHENLVVPRPIDDYSTATVLTMELVEGRSIGSLGPLALTEVDGAPLAEALFRAYLQQILEHGFVHADPHPGNVMLTDDGRLALIDLGMVARVSPPMQDSLVRLLLAISDGDGDAAADVLAAIGEPGEEFESDRFRRGIDRLVARHHGAEVGELDAGRVVTELARIAGQCGLRPPPELTMVGKALLNLDLVGTTLDPSFRPTDVIEDEVGAIMRRKLLGAARPSNLLSAALDAKEFAERLPGRVNKVFDALAEGELTVRVEAFDEKEFLRGIQKLANRLTTGLVITALIVGAAMVMRIETDARLFGYPALAIVLFLIASITGLWLVVTSLLNDLPQKRRRRH